MAAGGAADSARRARRNVRPVPPRGQSRGRQRHRKNQDSFFAWCAFLLLACQAGPRNREPSYANNRCQDLNLPDFRWEPWEVPIPSRALASAG